MKTGWIVAGSLVTALLINRKNPALIRTVWSLLPHPKVNNAVSDVDPITFDLQAYMGEWVQVYRTKNSFQNDQANYTTAKYTLKDDGTIKVLNTEIVNNDQKKQGEGFAIPEKEGDNTKLLVSFFPPFAGSYQILSLGPKNEDNKYTYALVGSPYSNYLWILSRNASLPDSVVQQLQQKAQAMGFVLDR